ncbi:MAG: hypothetical protein QG552_596 [Thermodesulfobacteriota bacterium]|nr:hypothetical protein [Thermodesulfobacteriota bacterium]
MALQIQRTKSDSWVKRYKTILMGAVLIVLMVSSLCLAESAGQRLFGSPEEGLKALISALESKDSKPLEAILGPESEDLVSSGDPVADNARHGEFIRLYEEKHRLHKETEQRVFLYVGKEDWPFPIPVVKKDSVWRFDTEAGREEILARRIGKNELSAIQVCLAVVDAQREYASKDRNGDGFREYAQKFRSEAGKKDGLYWETGEGDEQSPLGPLFAAAQEEGYAPKQSDDRPSPYHGYYYRILTAQGKNAPGGAYDYMVRGKMLGGFALVAYPAQYGASGIMTFVVNHDGMVYQKDLGEDTTKAAQAMNRFNPDSTWQKAIAPYAKTEK